MERRVIVVTLSEYLPTDNQQQPPISPQEQYLLYYFWQPTSTLPTWLTDIVFMWDLKFYLVDTRGDYEIKDKYLNPDGTAKQDKIAKDLTMLYLSNIYMLDGLYQTTKLEYNPIQNYSMVEESRETHSGTDKDKTTYGNTSRTDNYGTRTTTGSNTVGSQNNTNTDKVAPDNNETYYSRSQQTQSLGSHTDSMQSTTQGVIDTSTTTEHTDQNEYTHGHVVQNHLTRDGNIGVTTTQEMIMSQREVVKDLNIYEVLANMIVHQICKLVWSV